MVEKSSNFHTVPHKLTKGNSAITATSTYREPCISSQKGWTAFRGRIIFFFKGTILLKVNFIRPISTTFEFSHQNDMQFSLKIDVSDGKIWLKPNFCQMEIVENPSF